MTREEREYLRGRPLARVFALAGYRCAGCRRRLVQGDLFRFDERPGSQGWPNEDRAVLLAHEQCITADPGGWRVAPWPDTEGD